MNKINYFLGLVVVAFSLLMISSSSVEATSFSSSLLLSSKIDKVRDTQGTPLQKRTNYRLQIFSLDTSNVTPYYLYGDYINDYKWFWLTTDVSKSISVQINSKSEIETDGKQVHIINIGNSTDELVRYQHDFSHPRGGLYWGGSGHSDRYGFLRIEGDRDYKYFLTSNEGGIFADFSARSITTQSEDEYFLVSFVKI